MNTQTVTLSECKPGDRIRYKRDHVSNVEWLILEIAPVDSLYVQTYPDCADRLNVRLLDPRGEARLLKGYTVHGREFALAPDTPVNRLA